MSKSDPVFKPRARGDSRKDHNTIANADNPEFAGLPATMTAIRRHLDLTSNEYQECVTAQVFPTGINIDAARHRYIRYLKALARGERLGDSNAGARLDAKHQRGLLAAAQREKMELDMMERKGELANAKSISKSLNDAFASARTRLLGVPTKYAQQLSVMKRATEIEAVLKNGLKEILDELAETAHGVLGKASKGNRRISDDDAEASARSDGA